MDPNTAYALVLDTLHRASNQNTEILKPAEKKLQEWETEPGFYSILLNIVSNHTVDVNVRLLAVMCFKIGVDRYWRKYAPNGIAEDEKARLREGLLTPTMLVEPVNQVATQLAVLIAKIARYDCPAHWPELVPGLLTVMKGPGALEQHRALLTFHHIVKTLSAKRTIEDKRMFQELTSNVYSYILNIWDEHTQTFLRQIQEGATTEVITENLEKALYCLRILRKLTIFGMKKHQQSQEAINFLNVVFDRAKTSLECRKLLKGRGIYLLELCEKFIVHLTKVALGTLEGHPLSYVPLVATSLQFAIFYCFTEQGAQLSYERFTIQCLNLLKGILLCAEYKPAKIIERTKEPATLRAHETKLSIFDDQTVCHICRHLVTHYFLLSSDDLALWDADPESFATDDACETWKCSLRPCTESLFLTLIREFRNVLAPELVRLLDMVRQQPLDPHDLTAILRKDAVYNAVGLSAFDLYDEVDFDEWFTNGLVAEIRIKFDYFRIIRRRIAWLIGKWSRVKVSPSIQPMLYQYLLSLLDPTEDIAVRLASCDALSLAIDDFTFSAEHFTPFIHQTFSLLFDLLKEADECDTKMHVLTVLSFVAERNGEAVSDHAGDLLRYLPLLWDHAEQHNMLRCVIVSTLVQLVKALGTWHTPELQTLVLGVLEEATNTNRPGHIYLQEDGLELWRTALACCPTPPHSADRLLQLANNLPPLLDQTTEYLELVSYVIKAYIVLMPDQFLMGPGSECMKIMDSMLSDMRMEGVIMVLKLVETCLKVSRNDTTYLGIKVVWPTLIRVFIGLQSGEDFPTVLSRQLSIVSRLLLRASHLFLEAVREAAGNGDPMELLARIMDTCCERLNLVSQIKKRKIIGLGLSEILTMQIPCVLERFPSILQNLVEVLNDVLKTDDNGHHVDSLVPFEESCPSSPCRDYPAIFPAAFAENQHYTRMKKDLAASDYIHTLDLKIYLASKLEELRSQVGQPSFDQLMQSVDPVSIQQLREYIPI